jgi:hypothetical protein
MKTNEEKTLNLSTCNTLSELYEYSNSIPDYLKNDITHEMVSEAIKRKEQKIFKAQYWVTMNDKFMSGWGLAKNKVNKLIIACENYKQAEAIKRNADKRNEMKYVNICTTKPQIKSSVYPSWKHFEDMGVIWTK